MSEILSTVRVSPLLSLRTAQYVRAMVRESFDYNQWLKEVREQEAQAKQAEASGASGEFTPAKVDKPMSSPDDQHGTKVMRVPRAPRPHRQAKSPTPKARLRRWLEKVRVAWDEFQASRARDAVYGYLEAVFAIVEHYRVRRRTSRLLRHAFEFANLPFDKNADPFAAVIRCTCGNTVDSKMISKWARALRYVARSKEPDIGLQTFMKEAGGVNACAAQYARYYGRRPRL
jgi:type II secretory pathway component PulM